MTSESFNPQPEAQGRAVTKKRNGKITKGDVMRFSIRDLLLITIIAGVSFGWWQDRGKLIEANAALSRKFEQLQARHQAALNNEIRIAHLRAMEAWGRFMVEPGSDLGEA